MLIQNTIKPAVDFLKKIKPNEEVAIICGHDCDSVCSSAIIFRLIKKLIGIQSKLIVSDLNFSITEATFKKIKESDPDYIISLDIGEIEDKILRGLKKVGKVLVVDHHIPKNFKGIVYVNPRLYDADIYLPTSYIVYKLYEKFLDTREICWISAVGVLADHGVGGCKDLFEKLKNTNPELINDVEISDEKIFSNSLLGNLTKILNSARVVSRRGGAEYVVGFLTKTKKYKDVLGEKKLLNWFKVSEKEFKRLVEDFNKNKKIIGKVIIYEVKSKFNFHSTLANYLQEIYDDRILVIYQKQGNFIDFSFRRGKNVLVNLAELAGKGVKGIPNSSGGGHISASGARIPIEYFDKFLSNIKSYLK